MNRWSTTVANILLMTIITGFIVAGVRKKVNVYDAFIEGAKEGFTTAVRIIPYLVAILVGIGVFRASGAMDMLIGGLRACVDACGVDAQWVDTFYILAVYFGSVGVSKTRHAVTCGLLADLAGILAAIAVCYLFFA